MLAAIFGSVLPESSSCEIKGLNKDIGIVFTSDEKNSALINWTLPDLLSKDDTYITLATFFGRQRKRKYIRHVLGFAIDFDTPEDTTVEDILDLYHKARLPLPELIIATATEGHYQAFNLFPQPLRCKNEILTARIYRIHKLMAKSLGADIHARGAERWVRRPTAQNIVYHDSDQHTPWEELETWYEAHKPLKKPENYFRKVIYIVRFSALLLVNASKTRWPWVLIEQTILKETVMNGVMDLVCAYGMQVSPRVKSKQN